MPIREPADNFKDAWNWMELSLRERDDFESFYVQREHRCVDELMQMLRSSDECLHLLYSGYGRSGKSTELFRLMFELQDAFAPVYLSAQEELSPPDVKHIDVLFAGCMNIMREAEQRGVGVEDEIRTRVEGWVEQVPGEVKRLQSTGRTSGVEGEAGLGAWIGHFLARLRVEHETREEIRQTLEPKAGEIIDAIDLLAGAYQAELEKPPLLIVDDLEKADTAVVEPIFTRHTSSMLSMACDVIYTIPISLLNAPSMQAPKRAFDRDVVLPMIAVTDDEGDPREAGVEKITNIITERVSEDLFAGDTLRDIALMSGGVVADALRLARNCCLRALMSEAPQVGPDMVKDASEDLVLSYRRGLEEKYYPRLRTVACERDSEVDDEHRELMDALAILEYEDDPSWYDVHPAVRRLLESRKLV